MRTISHQLRIVTAFCALILGAAQVASAQDAADRCSLLTPAAVSSALGANVDAGQPIFNYGCSWQSLKPHIVVSISVGDDATYKIGKNAFQLRVYGVPDTNKQLAVEKTLARDVLKKL